MSLDRWLESYCDHEQREPEITNILYRIQHETNVQRAPPGHKVLCVEAPRHVRIMRIMIRQLPQPERTCIWMRFSYPRKKSGHLYTAEEKARFLGISARTFNRLVRSGKQRIYRELNRAPA